MRFIASILIMLIGTLPIISNSQELTKELAWAIKYGQTEYLDEWIGDNAINDCMSTGKSKSYNLLAMSIKLNSMKSLQYFVRRGANIELACEDKTPLMYASKYDKINMLNYLIDLGADPGQKVRGKTALYFARKFRNYRLVTALKEFN